MIRTGENNRGESFVTFVKGTKVVKADRARRKVSQQLFRLFGSQSNGGCSFNVFLVAVV